MGSQLEAFERASTSRRGSQMVEDDQDHGDWMQERSREA